MHILMALVVLTRDDFYADDLVIIADSLEECTVLPTKSSNDVMFCLQSYQGLIIGRSHVY